MSPEFLIVQAAIWSVVIVISVLAMRRSGRQFRAQLAEFDRDQARGRAEFQRMLDESDRRRSAREEASRQRLEQILAESEAIANDPDAGEEPAGVIIRVTFSPAAAPDDVATILRKLRTVIEETPSSRGGRIPIEVHAPAT